MFLWIVAGIGAGIVIFLVGGLLLLINFRRNTPHSDKKAEERARIAKRVKDINHPSTDEAKESSDGKRLEWLKEKFDLRKEMFWTVLIILAGVAALIYRGFDTELDLTDAGKLSREYWLQILIVYGIGASLIWLHAKESEGKTLQKALAGGVITLLVVLPWYEWMQNRSVTTQHASVYSDIPLASAPQSSWPQLIIAAGGESELIPVPPQMRPVLFGEDFRVHCVYRDGREIDFGKGEDPCPSGDMPFVYATNEAMGTNIVLYAYAPM